MILYKAGSAVNRENVTFWPSFFAFLLAFLTVNFPRW